MTALQDFSLHTLPVLEQRLRTLVAEAFPPQAAGLRNMLFYHMGWEGEGSGAAAQGKRIRPVLTLLTAEAAGGNWEHALPAAAAVELIHNFSLIHDDIQDQSELRHGRPALWMKVGVAQAINAGDAMFTLAFRALDDLRRTGSEGIAAEAVRILQQTCLELTMGQYQDLAFEQAGDLTTDDYWHMIDGKTASLLGACAGLGALTAGADAACCDHFTSFAILLGKAFQAQDDWLGIWGEPALTGKSNASDLVEGKKSLPVLLGLQARGEFARRWPSGKVPVAEVQAAADALIHDGVQAGVEKATQDLTARSRGHLEPACCRGNPQAAAMLVELSEQLLNRKK